MREFDFVSNDSVFTYTFPELNTTTTYGIRLTISGEAGCVDTCLKLITVYPTQEVNIISSNTFATERKDTLTAVFKGDSPTYQWAWMSEELTPGTNNLTNPLIVDRSGIYWVEAIDEDICLLSDSIPVTDLKTFFKYGVIQSGVVDFAGHNDENWYDTCSRTVTFVDNSFLSYTTVRSRLWTIEGMNISSEDPLFTVSFPEEEQAHTYVVRLQITTENDNYDVYEDSITIIPLPKQEVNIISSNTFATDRKDTLVAVFKGNFSTYQWSWILNDFTTGIDNISNPLIVAHSGIYWIEAQGEKGCLLTDTVRIADLKTFFKYGVIQSGVVDFARHNNENWYDTCSRIVTFVDSSLLYHTTVRSRLWTIEGMNVSSQAPLFTVSFPEEEQAHTYIVRLQITTENDNDDVYEDSITIIPPSKIKIDISQNISSTLSDTLTAVSVMGNFVSYQWLWVSKTGDRDTSTDNPLILTEPWISCFLWAKDDKGCYVIDTVYNNVSSISTNEYAKKTWTLKQNIPNPATNSTRIDYNIPEAGEVTFRLYNITGQFLYSKTIEAEGGSHNIELNTSKLCGGIYFYSIEYKGQRLVKRMVVR
jgi:hypothetical protein